MLYVNKNNKINFSEQELELLSNFSSIEEAINFCEAQIKNFGELASNLLTQSLRKRIGDWLKTNDPKILADIDKRRERYNEMYWVGKERQKIDDNITKMLSNPNLPSKTKERLLERREKLRLALRAGERKGDLIQTAEMVIANALYNNKFKGDFSFLAKSPELHAKLRPSSRLDFKGINNSVTEGLALDLKDGSVPYRKFLKGLD